LEFGEGDDLGFGEFFRALGVDFVERGGTGSEGLGEGGVREKKWEKYEGQKSAQSLGTERHEDSLAEKGKKGSGLIEPREGKIEPRSLHSVARRAKPHARKCRATPVGMSGLRLRKMDKPER
jgi:hypothetical protein